MSTRSCLDEPLNSLNKSTRNVGHSVLRINILKLAFLSLTHSGVATNGPELVTEADRPIDFLSVRDVPGVLGGVGSPTERASTSLDSDSLAGLRTSFTDTEIKMKEEEFVCDCYKLCLTRTNRPCSHCVVSQHSSGDARVIPSNLVLKLINKSSN